MFCLFLRWCLEVHLLGSSCWRAPQKLAMERSWYTFSLFVISLWVVFRNKLSKLQVNIVKLSSCLGIIAEYSMFIYIFNGWCYRVTHVWPIMWYLSPSICNNEQHVTMCLVCWFTMKLSNSCIFGQTFYLQLIIETIVIQCSFYHQLKSMPCSSA